MSDTDDIDRIREEKRERLKRATSGDGAETSEPIPVEGPDHLAELTSQYDVVLADFYADWCGPCQMLEPVVESIAAETAAVVAKVDVDANQSLAAQYGVRGVPTLLLFSDGETVEQMVGVQDHDRLATLVESYA